MRREAGAELAAQVRLVYRIGYSREPDEKELRQALDFLKGRALAELAHVILNSNEFVYIN